MKQLFIAIFSSIFMFGCEIAEPINSDIYDEELVYNEYVIGSGDQLYISVWQNPELSLTVPVRPDGKISAPLIGDQQAQGLTAKNLSIELEKKLNEYIRIPQVTVIVTAPSSSEYLTRIRITGAVNTPKSLPFRRDMTVLDLVLSAGSLTPFADGNESILYRKTPEGVIGYPVHVTDILKQGDLTSNYTLRPSDILIIPESVF